MELKIKFISNVNLSLWSSKFVNPTIPNITLTKTMKRHGKMTVRISVSTLIPLLWVTNHFLIWRHFPVVGRWICQPQLSAISIWQKQWQIYLLLGNSIKNGCNNLYLHTKPLKALFPLWFWLFFFVFKLQF